MSESRTAIEVQMLIAQFESDHKQRFDMLNRHLQKPVKDRLLGYLAGAILLGVVK